MIIQYLNDAEHDNTEVHGRTVPQERYTEAFEYSFICQIEKDFKPYAVKSRDELWAFQSLKDHSIWTLTYEQPGCVTIKSFDRFIIKSVSIYDNNKLMSPQTLSNFVYAAINNKEIRYHVSDTWFQWDLSWGLVKEIKEELYAKSKHM